MDWSIWIFAGVVAILLIGAAWWSSEHRRIEAWRDQNRAHADPVEPSAAEPDGFRHRSGSV